MLKKRLIPPVFSNTFVMKTIIPPFLLISFKRKRSCLKLSLQTSIASVHVADCENTCLMKLPRSQRFPSHFFTTRAPLLECSHLFQERCWLFVPSLPECAHRSAYKLRHRQMVPSAQTRLRQFLWFRAPVDLGAFAPFDPHEKCLLVVAIHCWFSQDQLLAPQLCQLCHELDDKSCASLPTSFHFFFPLVLIPRTVAGTQALPSLPRT